MTKILNNKFLFAAILCVLLVVVALTFSVRSTETVSADYQDIINDSTALVNFNQYYSGNNPLYISTSSSSRENHYSQNFNHFVNSHVYYIVNRNNIDYLYFTLVMYNNGTYVRYRDFNTDTIFTPSNDVNSAQIQVNTLGAVNSNCYFGIIDLSQMFGAENIPSLEECQQLFVADSYPYNTGTAMSLTGLNSYADGYNSAMSTFDITYNISDFNTNVYSLNGEMSFSRDYSSSFLSVNFNGSVAFPLGFNFVKGDLFTITLKGVNLYSYLNQYPRGVFRVGYLDDNNNFVPFYSITNDSMTYVDNSGNGGPYFYNAPSTLDISVVCPATISAIVFKYDYSGTDSWQDAYVRIGAFSLTGKTYNATLGINQAYDSGYQQAENIYQSQLESYTSETGSGYQNIYNNGYQDGLNAQVSEARKKTYTFTNFLGALFDVPVTTLKSLLDFNFLGFNLKNFVFSILTLSIVFAIIKLILVKTGDSK